MTYEELARATYEVRQLQKEYFRTRSRTTLQESKEKERALDRALAKIIEKLEATTT